jgi:hypothetical protein
MSRQPKQAKKESWDFLIDLGQVPYNQKPTPSTVNLEIKRKIEEIDKKMIWYLGRAGTCQDLYLLIVNTEEDAEEVRNITNARKGKPFEIKLEERTSRRDENEAKWNEEPG